VGAEIDWRIPMSLLQWGIAAGTAIFVALVGYFQWRTAQQKAALDLFDRRHLIYLIVRKAVGTMCSSSPEFDQQRETEFIANMEDAYFFFGDDVKNYLEQLLNDILDVRTADAELPGAQADEERKKILERRRIALNRIGQFYKTGQAIFARYMRFKQTVA
jgi:hypothetical protein